VNKNNVLKQCKKILKIEKKVGKRKVNLKECRMHNQPLFADWSMYRENDSSFMAGANTQQIIFLFEKKEYVITSTCWEKCNATKKDLFNLIESIKF
jgi:CRISPR/Cas system CMR-associated protein Cmr3 (group 5 of RAMP superfamily)